MRTLTSFLLIFCCCSFLSAQQFSVDRTTELFTVNPISKSTILSTKGLESGTILSLDVEQYQALMQTAPAYFSMVLPLEEGTAELILERQIVLGDDFVARDSEDRLVPYTAGLHYRAKVKGANSSVAAVSFFKDRMMGVIFVDGSNYNLERAEDLDEKNGSQEYLLYKESAVKNLGHFDCHSDDVKPLQNLSEQVLQTKGQGFPIGIYIECDNKMYTDFDSDISHTIDYMTGLFNVVKTFYTDIGVTIFVQATKVWDQPDPYGTIGARASSRNVLSEFVCRVQDYDGRLAHLLSTTDSNLGGIANLPSSCNYKQPIHGFSNIRSVYNANINTFSWSVEVFAHELGHNLGSPHTHACFWNGNGTPIDDCGNAAAAAGQAEGDSRDCWNSASPNIPTKGTIMSYCHLSAGNGIDLSKGFHPQVANQIFNFTENCLEDFYENECGPDSTAMCSAPSLDQLSVTNVTATSARLNSAVTGENYLWRYRELGTCIWIQTEYTSDNFLDIQNLANNTAYEFNVNIVCSGRIFSRASCEKVFVIGRVDPSCERPSNNEYYADQVETFNAHLNAAYPEGEGYKWQYRIKGTNNLVWTGEVSTLETSIEIRGLAASTTYEYRLAVQCTENAPFSLWSAIKSFTTQPEDECSSFRVDARVIVHPDCGQSDGVLDIDITDGTPGYLITWSGPISGRIGTTQRGHTLENAPTGMYEITARDKNGCEKTINYFFEEAAHCNIDECTGFAVNISSEVLPRCGSANGSVTLDIDAGTADYMISWSGAATGSVTTADSTYMITDLSEGILDIMITDANDCETSKRYQINCDDSMPNLALNSTGTLSFTGTIANIAGLEIINNGTADADAFMVNYYISDDTNVTSDDISLGSEMIMNLGVDATQLLDLTANVGELDLAVGTYYIGLIIDAAAAIEEENEADNSYIWENPTVDIIDNSACRDDIVALGCGESVNGNTTGMTNQFSAANYTACYTGNDPYDGGENIYRIDVPTNTGKITLQLSRFRKDLNLFLMDGCDPTATCVTSSDPNSRFYKTIELDNPTLATYYLVVDGANMSQSSSYRLFARCMPAASNFITNGNATTDKELSVQAYPNPTQNSLTVNINTADNSDVQVQILNAIGQVINNYSADNVYELNQQIDLSNQQAGVYYLKVQTATSTHLEPIVLMH